MPKPRCRINLSVSPADYDQLRRAAGPMPAARWVIWAALRMAEAVVAEVEKTTGGTDAA